MRHHRLALLQLGCVGLLIGQARASFAAPALTHRRLPSPSEVTDVIDALFGTVSSRQAFARQACAEEEVTQRFTSRSKELTYGEFDLDFFLALLRDAQPQPGESFCDVGSGCGRLVLAAALAHPWRRASGVEVLDNLHQAALTAHERLCRLLEAEAIAEMAPCHFVCAEADDALPPLLSGVDQAAGAGLSGGSAGTSVVFCFATCWPGAGPYLPQLSATLARHLPLGSRIVTVDKQLVEEEEMGQWSFTQIGQREAKNYATHSSVGYVYELTASAAAAAAATTTRADAPSESAASCSGSPNGSPGPRRPGTLTMCAAAAEEGAPSEEEPTPPSPPPLGPDDTAPPAPAPVAGGAPGLSLSSQMRALADAAEAQAEASEAFDDAFDEIEQMVRASAASAAAHTRIHARGLALPLTAHAAAAAAERLRVCLFASSPLRLAR